MSDVTQLANAIEAGEPNAAEQLISLVYEEWRKLASVRMAGKKTGQTLQVTALGPEAWLKLNGGSWPSRRMVYRFGTWRPAAW